MLIITPSKINITCQPASGYTWTAYGRRSASDFWSFSFPPSSCRLSKRLHLGNAYLGKKHMGGMHCQELGKTDFTRPRGHHTHGRVSCKHACSSVFLLASALRSLHCLFILPPGIWYVDTWDLSKTALAVCLEGARRAIHSGRRVFCLHACKGTDSGYGILRAVTRADGTTRVSLSPRRTGFRTWERKLGCEE